MDDSHPGEFDDELQRQVEDCLEWRAWANRVCFEVPPAEQMEANRRHFEAIYSILYGDSPGFPSGYLSSAEDLKSKAVTRLVVESDEADPTNYEDFVEVIKPDTSKAQHQIEILRDRITALRAEYVYTRTDISILEEKLARQPDSQSIRDRLAFAHSWMNQVAAQGKSLADDQRRLIEFVNVRTFRADE